MFRQRASEKMAIDANRPIRGCGLFAIRLSAIVCAALLLYLPAAVASVSLRDRLDQVDRQSFENWDGALNALDSLAFQARDSAMALPDDERLLWEMRGLLFAQKRDEQEVRRIAGRLRERAVGLSAAEAQRFERSAQVVEAALLDAGNQSDKAMALVLQWMPELSKACEPAVTEACDYRLFWRSLRWLERGATRRGLLAEAQQHAEKALRVVRQMNDDYRLSQTAASLAWLYARSGDAELTQRYLAESRHAGAAADDLQLRARNLMLEAAIAVESGENERGRDLTLQALAVAGRAGANRLRVHILNNIADAELRLGHSAPALQAINEALPIARRFGDVTSERTLLTNRGVAHIRRGDIASGLNDLTAVEALLARMGSRAEQVSVLREYGEAFAAAGEAERALELYHRERAISAVISEENRQSALHDIQTAFEAEKRQRDIDMLASDNAIKDAELATNDLQQRVWLVLATALGLAAFGMVFAVRKLSRVRRRLHHHKLTLTEESERDPLTGLGNRRAWERFISGLGPEHWQRSALFLIDVDHFKAINDQFGHGEGDAVLCEVSRRLQSSLRSSDLLIRWGGEEFLVLAHALGEDQFAPMLQRLLMVVASSPIDSGEMRRDVTVSIGACRLEGSVAGLVLPWQRALVLTDLALYGAKHSGRNMAVGIADWSAQILDAGLAVADGLQHAESRGWARLLTVHGPKPLLARLR